MRDHSYLNVEPSEDALGLLQHLVRTENWIIKTDSDYANKATPSETMTHIRFRVKTFLILVMGPQVRSHRECLLLTEFRIFHHLSGDQTLREELQNAAGNVTRLFSTQNNVSATEHNPESVARNSQHHNLFP
jgi:hypothetical protein